MIATHTYTYVCTSAITVQATMYHYFTYVPYDVIKILRCLFWDKNNIQALPQMDLCVLVYLNYILSTISYVLTHTYVEAKPAITRSL